MADPTSQTQSKSLPETLPEWALPHLPLLRELFEKKETVWRPTDLDFDQFCLELVSILPKPTPNREPFDKKIHRLMDFPEMHLCMGLMKGDPEAMGAAMKWPSLQEALKETFTRSESHYSFYEYEYLEFCAFTLALAAKEALRKNLPLATTLKQHLQFPDVYLAGAVLSTNLKTSRHAKDKFTRLYLQVIDRYLNSVWRSLPDLQDRRQSYLLCLMHDHPLSEKTGNKGKTESMRPPLLTEYRGSGQLSGWLTGCLGNLIRDSFKSKPQISSLDEVRENEDGDSQLPVQIVSVPARQTEALEEGPCIQMLKKGLQIGWQKIKVKEKFCLMLQTLYEIKPSTIARHVLFVHESTVTGYTKNGLETLYRSILEQGRVMGLALHDAAECMKYTRQAFPGGEDLASGMVMEASGS